MNTAERAKPVLLFVAPYFPPACYGGVVQVYLGLLRDLHAYRVIVVSDRHGSTAEECRTWDAQAPSTLGFEVRRLSAFELHIPRAHTTLWSRLKYAVRLFFEARKEWSQLLQELQPDMVVCGGTYSAGWVVRRTPANIPLINYIHGEELTMQLRPRLLQPYFRGQQFRLLRQATLNICVSRYTAELTRKLARVRQDRIALLPNAVDTDRFHVGADRAHLRTQFGWSDRLVLYTLARLEPRKGVDQALRALAQLAHAGELPREWLYVIAGRGEQQPMLATLAGELGIADHVEFAGFVPDNEVAARYQAADIFLQTNREIRGDTEGFGIVFLEANACGLPVIGGIAGGTADAIEEGYTGLRVDAENITAIASAIRTLVQNPTLRHRMGQQGAARVRESFTLPRAREQFRALLTSAHQQHSARFWLPGDQERPTRAVSEP